MAASFILGLTIIGAFGVWSGMFRRIGRAREAGQAAQIARAEVERAKVFGMSNLPMGTYNSSTSSATWTGAYSTTANAWSAGGASYYDVNGNRLASAATAGAAFKLQTTINDSNVVPNGSGYSLQLESRRSLTVKVTSVADGSDIYQVATIVALGGL